MFLMDPNHPRAMDFYESRRIINQKIQEHYISKQYYIIHPFSKFHIAYKFIVILLYPLGFGVSFFLLCSITITRKEILYLNLIYYMDMIIIFFTGYIVSEEQDVVLNQKKIAKKYLRTYFFFDLIPNLPYGLFYSLYSKQHWFTYFYLYGTLIELLKMSRLITIQRYARELFKYFEIRVKPWFVIIASLMLYVLSIILASGIQILSHTHVSAFQLSYDLAYYDEHTWIKKNSSYQSLLIGNIPAPQYLSFYLVHVTLSLGILPPIEVDLWYEKLMWLLTLILCGGANLLLMIVTLTYFLSKSSTEVKFHCLMNQVEAYMESKNLPQTLQTKIKMYYKYKYRNQYFRDEYIKAMLSDNLNREINRYICKTWIENFPVLAKMPTYKLNQLMTHFELKIYMHGETIFEYGNIPQYTYFINSGTVALYTKSGIEFRHIEDGGYYGAMAYFFGLAKTHIVTAISLELTEMYCLPIRYMHLLYTNEEAKINVKKSIMHTIDVIRKTEEEYSEKILKLKLESIVK